MSLPILQSESSELTMVQTRWASQINPILANLLMQGQLLRNVALTAGANQINHKLGRKLVGWFLTRQRGASIAIYDNQDSNQMPQLTLSLQSGGTADVDIYVF